MGNVLEMLQPSSLWRFFEEISSIPHTSHDLAAITGYIVAFAENRNLDYRKDATGNIVIRKGATPGMESRRCVILQAHMDMVGQKNEDVCHDFKKDPLRLEIEDGFVTADGTTLGADNGIGMAAILAILDSSDISHPDIEALFTVDEETGMFGVTYMDRGMLKGTVMINTDSEESDKIFVGCAGGIDFKAHFPYDENKTSIPPSDMRIMKIELKGLNGGHSGVDIHMGRANANLLMFRFLKFISEGYGARICSVRGGNARNAIPREAVAYVAAYAADVDVIAEEAAQYQALYRNEYAGIDDVVCLTAGVVAGDVAFRMLPVELQEKLVNAVVATPDGVERMMPQMPQIVETSSCLSIIDCNNGEATIQILVRSVSASRKYNRISVLGSLYSLAGAEIEVFGDYPGWMLPQSSPLLQTAKECYYKRFGVVPETKVMHAGLECGIFSSIYPGVDIISIGPDLLYPHSPDEKVNIASVAKFWTLLCDILVEIPEENR